MLEDKAINWLRSLKHSSQNLGKDLVETALRNHVWIDRSANRDTVSRIIRILRPVPSKRPLIRIGGQGDGGYLMPDDFEGIQACISPGVADEVSFDVEMAPRGIDVIMADASVDGPPISRESFRFLKKFLGIRNDQTTIRLDDLVAELGSTGDLIFQMDIEGAEFPVLMDCSTQTLKRFHVIILEVHDFTHVFGKFGAAMLEAFAEKITRTHAVVHTHANNCCGSVSRYGLEVPRVMEFTLYRRDRGLVLDGSEHVTIPHPLDCDNVPGKPHLALGEIWR